MGDVLADAAKFEQKYKKHFACPVGQDYSFRAITSARNRKMNNGDSNTFSQTSPLTPHPNPTKLPEYNPYPQIAPQTNPTPVYPPIWKCRTLQDSDRPAAKVRQIKIKEDGLGGANIPHTLSTVSLGANILNRLLRTVAPSWKT